MKFFLLRRTLCGPLSPRRANRGEHTSALMAVFALGVVLGYFVGELSAYSPSGFVSDFPSESFGSAWAFFLLLMIFSTSYLGPFFIPCLFFLRGYLFSCSVAVLWNSMGTDGMLLALLSSAVPLCFSLPAYLVVGGVCFSFSRHLARLRFSGGGLGPEFPLRHLLLMVFVILLDFSYSAFLLPAITNILI